MKTLKAACLMLFLFIPCGVFAQKKPFRSLFDSGGNLSLGVRSTVSTFSHGKFDETGIGSGGHFRLQLTDRINTEWYFDYLHTDIQKKAYRRDYHIGWSVMYYLIKTKNFTRPVTPFIVAGHCFDHTRITPVNRPQERQQRGSSAVQAGLGTHFNITPRFDISLKCQYMLHLGPELHAHIHGEDVEIEKHKNAGWEGHLLISISANYKIARLWKPKG
ncbi:MAG: hypothetical protein MH137_04505 [Flavobacteriales bacterium]|nr:hypothetical protein [Flavobacteriales bacterium]